MNKTVRMDQQHKRSMVCSGESNSVEWMELKGQILTIFVNRLQAYPPKCEYREDLLWRKR